MHDPKAIEAMARAMAAEAGHDNPEFVAPAFRAPAKAALTALCTLHPGVAAILSGEAVAVPREATEPMYDAGYDATRLEDGMPQFYKDGFCLGHAGKIYRAMLAASPYAQETPDAE